MSLPYRVKPAKKTQFQRLLDQGRKADTLALVASAIIGLALAVLGPVAYLWALNTLFPALAIPFTWETWLAAFLFLSGPPLIFTTVTRERA